MIVESCKSGDCSMDFGKTGGMSTATLSQRSKRGAKENRGGEGCDGVAADKIRMTSLDTHVYIILMDTHMGYIVKKWTG